MNPKYTLLVIAFLLSLSICFGQNEGKAESYLQLQTAYIQLKDEFNYGLVNQGMNLNIGYGRTKYLSRNVLNYCGVLGFGANYRQGIGLMWVLKPVDLFYGYSISREEVKRFYVGPYLSVNYHWNLYPELQSGHLFWFSSFETGVRIWYDFTIKNRQLKLMFSNSIMGLNSRPLPSTETYYYSLKFSDFAGNPHKNIVFGSFNQFNHTVFRIEMPGINKKRFSIGYKFENYGYFKTPTYHFMSHIIVMGWRLGK